VLIADWEYDILNRVNWDMEAVESEIDTRLASFNMLNKAQNVITFQWAYMYNISAICTSMTKIGFKRKRQQQWFCWSPFKKSGKGTGGVSYAGELVNLCIKNNIFRSTLLLKENI